MRTLTKEEEEKIKLFDKLFTSMPLEELQEFVSQEMVVARLKNIPQVSGLFYDLIADNQKLNSDVMILNGKLVTMEMEFNKLLKILNNGLFNATAQSEFYNLKSSHCVY